MRLYVRLTLMIILLISAASNAIADSLEASADRQTISVNETLNLRLVYEGQQSGADPDFSVLAQQFDVLSNQKSMQHSIINGAVSASTEWRLILAPKSTGQLLIPPFTYNGERSQPITITVTEPSADPVSGAQDVFIETSVSKSDVFVQEQFVITFRLYYNRSVDSLDAPQLAIDNARIEPLPRVDYRKTIGGTTYGVAEYRYAVFADSSGSVDIPSQTWTVRTTDQPSMSRFGYNSGRYKLHRAKTEALDVAVAPKPAEYPSGAVWLPVEDVDLEESWSRAPETFKVGEPITRTVTLRAQGAAAEQLAPIIDAESTDDFKFYPDKPAQDTRITESGVVGTRTESVAIVPARAGELTLPAVEVTWWNTQAQQVETTRLPERVIDVTGAAVPVPPSPPADSVVSPAATPAKSDPSKPWGWIALCTVLAIGNAIAIALLLRRRSGRAAPIPQGPSTQVDTEASFKEVLRACDSNSVASARAAILTWARLCWGQRASSLIKLGQLSGDSALLDQLRRLDAVLFAGAPDDIDYRLLRQRLEQLQKSRSNNAGSGQLKPLYAAT